MHLKAIYKELSYMSLKQKILSRFPYIEPEKLFKKVLDEQASLEERAVLASINGIGLNDWKFVKPKKSQEKREPQKLEN